MWISIKIFQFLNFNRAFKWLEKGTVKMTFPRRHVFHSLTHTHTHMTDPPIVASHYFKEDFNSWTKQKSLKISRYVAAQFGVCDCDIDTSALKTKKVFSGKYQHKNQCFFLGPLPCYPCGPKFASIVGFHTLATLCGPEFVVY